MEQATISNPPPPHVSPPGIWITKLLFRGVQIIFSIAMLGVMGAIVSVGVWSGFAYVLVAPATVVSICWALAEGICIIARRGRRGIHPGANVALDLLLWLGFVATTVSVWLLLDVTGWYYYDYYGSSYGGSLYSPYSSSRYRYTYITSNELRDLKEKTTALLGLGGTLTVLHFVTFVIACYETNVRNRKPHTTIIVQQQPYQGMAMGYPANPVTYEVKPPAPVGSPAPGYGYTPNTYQNA
ncbi:hypothetical protein QBC35DRAFT_65653 [Podospora australis]|uniref:MARVEL domain-containing protein n=1 Tax=Podospora australis TaxID=1536484 RepID=A0AAN6WLS2_9PEZI|nr:hypothetical protein QBC35DRAFT_65653 [Podospora australis]